jgi:hypothetical protein
VWIRGAIGCENVTQVRGNDAKWVRE